MATIFEIHPRNTPGGLWDIDKLHWLNPCPCAPQPITRTVYSVGEAVKLRKGDGGSGI